MKNPLVSIIIVNYNGIHLLPECLDSIQKSSYLSTEVIVVDNGSSDGSINYLKKKKITKQAIQIILNEQNIGFARANNQGIEIAKGEYFLLLNNDAVLEKETIEILVSTLQQDSTIAVVQPKILFYKTKKLQSGAAFFTYFGFLYYFGFGHNPNDDCYNKTMDIFSANGACMLIRKSVISEVGLFDGDFFAYYEETDFCHRVLLSGQRIVYVPQARAFHKGGQTAITLNQSFIFFHSFKNRLNSAVKNFELLTLWRIVPSLLTIYAFLLFIYLLRGKLEMSRAVFLALLWNVFNFKKTIKKRRLIQRNIRLVKDIEYLKRTLKGVSPRYYYNMFLDKKVLLEEEKC